MEENVFQQGTLSGRKYLRGAMLIYLGKEWLKNMFRRFKIW